MIGIELALAIGAVAVVVLLVAGLVLVRSTPETTEPSTATLGPTVAADGDDGFRHPMPQPVSERADPAPEAATSTMPSASEASPPAASRPTEASWSARVAPLTEDGGEDRPGATPQPATQEPVEGAREVESELGREVISEAVAFPEVLPEDPAARAWVAEPLPEDPAGRTWVAEPLILRLFAPLLEDLGDIMQRVALSRDPERRGPQMADLEYRLAQTGTLRAFTVYQFIGLRTVLGMLAGSAELVVLAANEYGFLGFLLFPWVGLVAFHLPRLYLYVTTVKSYE